MSKVQCKRKYFSFQPVMPRMQQKPPESKQKFFLVTVFNDYVLTILFLSLSSILFVCIFGSVTFLRTLMHVCWLDDGPSFGLCQNFLNRQGSYTSELQSDHLISQLDFCSACNFTKMFRADVGQKVISYVSYKMSIFSDLSHKNW